MGLCSICIFFPIFCDKLKLVFTEVTPNIFVGNDNLASCTDLSFISPSLHSISSPTTTPEPEPSKTPLPYPTQSPSPPECRIVHIATDNEISSIHIENTQFTKITSNDNGASVFILNSGISCINNIFQECISRESGGGIYISNSCDYDNNINIEDQIFNKCQSEYGGGIFFYSYSNKCIFDITSCIFTNNQDTAKESTETRYKGGSCIYIKSRNAKIYGCVFKNNRGNDSVIKIYNKKNYL